MRPLHKYFERRNWRFFRQKFFWLGRPAPKELVEPEEKFLAKKNNSSGSKELCNDLITSEKKFGLLRSIAWPIHRSEAKKVVSMLLLLGLLCVCYSILRNIKDTIIITTSGAEAITFIKVWGILPGAIAATWIYTKLRSRFNREHIFYIMIGGFVAYFLLYAFVIFPNSQALHFTSLSQTLQERLPQGFNGLINMICNWTATTFYIISEMWASIVLTILFWSFAHDITPLTQAKRSYGLLNIGSNIAPILGGSLALFFINNLLTSSSAPTDEQWHFTLIKLTLLISLFAIAAMGVFYWINRKVLPDDSHAKENPVSTPKDKKGRLSLRACIKYISKSKYLICLSLIVLGFNIAINFTDILWKSQLKKHFINPTEMITHMNQVTIGIGCIATLGGILFSFMIRRLGWSFVALLTPAIMVTTAIGFFSFIFFENALTGITMSLMGTTPLIMSVYLGSMQNCLSKAGKYSVFDASKEIAFLTLDSESRLRGKAAIDGLGSGVGKSGASLTYQAMILGLGSITLAAPYIAGILIVVFAAWIYSVKFVAKDFTAKSEEVVPEMANS